MIKLFITDLDGCVSDPFITPDWRAFSDIRELNIQSVDDPDIPMLSICTGRPMPYAEAVAQMLGIRIPFIFESGGGMYDVVQNKLTWTPALTPDIRRQVEEIKEWAMTHIMKSYPRSIPEFAKFTDIGIINPDTPTILKIFDESERFIAQGYPDFMVHRTEVSVNIILRQANKGEGIRMLCNELGYHLSEVAYIGDSSGDIAGLEIVGRSFAPANAAPEAKAAAQEVTRGRSTKGVIEAYYSLLVQNLEK
jgi:hydroxymethylpyrimidine pyrophosphatase-like HAD family hydrolase